MAKHNKIGEMGESIAAKYLKNKGFSIIDRNYRRKWGELDIIAQKDLVLHFIEVKTVSRKSFGGHFEQEINNYRPEDNMHPWKLKRLRRVLQTYLLESHFSTPFAQGYGGSKKASRDKNKEIEWQFDLACVFLDQEKRVAKVKFIENLIL